jgi:hypothetical protein
MAGHRIWTAVLSVAVLALVAGPHAAWAERAAARPSDIRATRTYLLAAHELAQTSKGLLPVEKAALHALVGEVSGQCPNVLAGSPRDEATDTVRAETLGLAALAEYRQRRPALIAFANKVQPLRWSNRTLTYFVHGFIRESVARTEIVPPDICADARAVAASGFQTTPADVIRFARQLGAAEDMVRIGKRSREESGEDVEEVIVRMLKPYERRDERALIPRPPRGVTPAEIEADTAPVTASLEIIRALGLRPGF